MTIMSGEIFLFTDRIHQIMNKIMKIIPSGRSPLKKLLKVSSAKLDTLNKSPHSMTYLGSVSIKMF